MTNRKGSGSDDFLSPTGNMATMAVEGNDIEEDEDDDPSFIDLDEIPSLEDLPLAPSGEWDATIDEAEHTYSSNGKAMWKIRFAYDTLPDGTAPKVYQNYMLQAKSRPFVRAFLETVAPDAPRRINVEDPSFLVGRRARIKVVHKRYEGRFVANIKRVKAPGAVGEASFLNT